MYYQPATVPVEFHQPMGEKGIERGHEILMKSGGFNEGHWNAIQEGGPRNGVLTAVEDFIKQSPHEYYLVIDDRQWGLGIPFRRSARDAARLVRALRFQVFRMRHVDPRLRAWHELVLRMKMSRVAGRLRRVRDGILRR